MLSRWFGVLTRQHRLCASLGPWGITRTETVPQMQTSSGTDRHPAVAADAGHQMVVTRLGFVQYLGLRLEPVGELAVFRTTFALPDRMSTDGYFRVRHPIHGSRAREP